MATLATGRKNFQFTRLFGGIINRATTRGISTAVFADRMQLWSAYNGLEKLGLCAENRLADFVDVELSNSDFDWNVN